MAWRPTGGTRGDLALITSSSLVLVVSYIGRPSPMLLYARSEITYSLLGSVTEKNINEREKNIIIFRRPGGDKGQFGSSVLSEEKGDKK